MGIYLSLWTHGGTGFRKSGLKRAMVFHQDGLPSGWSFIRVVFHQGGLSSGWSFIRMVFHQGGLSSGWSFIRMVFHQDGLSILKQCRPSDHRCLLVFCWCTVMIQVKMMLMMKTMVLIARRMTTMVNCKSGCECRLLDLGFSRPHP